MTSTFKLIKAEFKKVFKHPSIYIVALLIVATIFGCMYMFEPTLISDKNISYSGATTAKDYYDYFYNTAIDNSQADIQNTFDNANILVNYYKTYYNKMPYLFHRKVDLHIRSERRHTKDTTFP